MTNLIVGTDGDDRLEGTAEDDFFLGKAGNDLMIGFDGNDALYGGAGDDVLFGGRGDDHMVGNVGNDVLIGGRGNDEMWGHDGNDRFDGEQGADQMYGGAGDDVFQNMLDTDTDGMWGGEDADRFHIMRPDYDVPIDFAPDRIHDFEQGIDKIGLPDADWSTDEHDPLVLASRPTAHAAWVKQKGGSTFIYGDVDGDKRADFEVELVGRFDLSEADFIL